MEGLDATKFLDPDRDSDNFALRKRVFVWVETPSGWLSGYTVSASQQ